MVKHSKAFAGRPQLHTFKLANHEGNSLTPRHNDLIRSASLRSKTLRRCTDAFKKKMLQESQRMVHCFKLQKNKPVDALITPNLATADIIFGALFSTNGSYPDTTTSVFEDFSSWHADSYREARNGRYHVDFLPPLKYLPNKVLSKLKFLLKAYSDVTTKMFVENEKTYTEEHVRNIADSFISVVEKLETMKIWDSTIPKVTIVFVNLLLVHRDPRNWSDPAVFNPVMRSRYSTWYTKSEGTE